MARLLKREEVTEALDRKDVVSLHHHIEALESELAEARASLERDRTKVAECVTAVQKELHSYDWLINSRGSYEWDDDRWHGEFKTAHDAILEAISPMVKIASDWSHCPKSWDEVQKARNSEARASTAAMLESLAKRWRQDSTYTSSGSVAALVLVQCAAEALAAITADQSAALADRIKEARREERQEVVECLLDLVPTTTVDNLALRYKFQQIMNAALQPAEEDAK